MPIINAEEAIKDGFKQIRKDGGLRTVKPGGCLKGATEDTVIKPEELQKVQPSELRPAPTPAIKELPQDAQLEQLFLPRASTQSGFSSFQSGSSRGSQGESSISSENDIFDDSPGKLLEEGASAANGTLKQKVKRADTEDSGLNQDGELSGLQMGDVDAEEERVQGRLHIQKKKKKKTEDRRRATWLPCTCPQYKVSNQLAMRKEVQGIFFCKILTVKVIQLFIINLTIFSTGLLRDTTLQFFKSSHDWAYLAFGLFVSLLLCLRVALSFRARWPKAVGIILMIPLTLIIAFTSSCVTVVYNSVIIPLVTCGVFLTFLLLSFTPYLLKRLVMDRSTNFAASGIAFLVSVFLIFLKEMESAQITYWDFISHVWLPGLLLTQFVVQATVIEIQRIIFGLCFNVSSTRWHVAALYI